VTGCGHVPVGAHSHPLRRAASLTCPRATPSGAPRTAHRLDQVLADQTLTSADLRWPQLATADLRGATTIEVVSRGKHILHRLDNGLTLHTHLRMDGQWRVTATPKVTSRQLDDDRIRAVVGTVDWTCIGTRLGMGDLIETSREDTLVGHLGPDVLGPDWDARRAADNMRTQPGRAIGDALLDQRNLAGVGTMYAAESLFVQRQPPWQRVADVSAEALDALIDRARRLLDANRVNAVPCTTGRHAPGETHHVHARSGRPCRRCGSTVRVAMIGEAPRERTMFYCPTCQGGLGPTDDGAVQRPMGSAPRRSRG